MMKDMRILGLFVFVVFGVALCGVSQLYAEEGAPATSAKRGILFTPPLRGAPETRVGGGTRGGADSADKPVLTVLVPASTGFTTQESPALFWFQSKPVKGFPVKLTMNNPDDEPILEVELNGDQVGIQSVSLAAKGIKLKPDEKYEWNVQIVYDSDVSTKNLLSGGSIKRVPCPAALQAELTKAGVKDRPLLYAAAGMWYDSVQELSDQIAASGDKKLIELRAELLEQAGLPEAAHYDRDRIK